MYLLHRILIITGITLLCSACQLVPPAKGLPTLIQLQQQVQTEKQQQVDIFWKDQSFSFLLYQHQFADHLQVLALSFTGQVLFELQYDGKRTKVIQRIDAMRHLPLDYVLRDILWGTMDAASVQQQTQMLGLKFEEKGLSPIYRLISQQRNNQAQLKILQQDQQIEIENLNVPYRMVLSSSQSIFGDDNSIEVTEPKSEEGTTLEP